MRQTEGMLEQMRKQNNQDKDQLKRQIEQEKKSAQSIQEKTDVLLKEKREADQRFEEQKKELEKLQL